MSEPGTGHVGDPGLIGAMRVGDPLDPGTDLGPVVTAGQRQTIRGYIEQGSAEGATLVAGGQDPPAGLNRVVFSDDGATAVEVAGSAGDTSNSKLASKRVSISDAPSPIARPAPISGKDWRTIKIRRSLRTAPSAMRTPNSRVRSATE